MNELKGKTVLLLGSGGLRISQAGEFDYSGSQAIKALKEDGVRVVLLNPNIATVQTDPGMADTVYLQPLNVPTVERIIEQEKPDAILLGFGGQTALNLGLELEDAGILKKHNVTVLGTSTDAIRKAEDRALFKAELDSIDVKVARSVCASTVEEALAAAEEIGFPLMIRAGFSLGGMGSGLLHNPEELGARVKEALSAAPHVLVEECLLGWSEFEYEIVRDRAGNVITVCNMENFDPMGVHTGESIVISPSQSLNNAQYHFLRTIACKVAEHFKIIGECNIQYAFNLKTGDYRVIEINPRLSRSSALASKATGYPLAFVAAKLAAGYTLDAIKNRVTNQTCAFFEPALDYIVVKIPRWDIEKFKADRRIGTSMKSVGEVMAIGRSFPEALQKAVGMMNVGAHDLADYPQHIEDPKDEIQTPTDRRLFALHQFFVNGGSVEEATELSQIDPWFLQHLHQIAQIQLQFNAKEAPSIDLLRTAKKAGFSDHTIAKLTNKTPTDIRELRKANDITPVIKQIDTLAGEFVAETNYLYLTYHGTHHDITPSDPKPIIVLGSGPYSIGSSVEFDWCAVNTVRTLREHQESAIIINSNPETVSTDYDESDRLYFEQLSLERVQDIADFEQCKGLIVSVGGQVANNLALPLAESGYPILGTPATSIDQAENRSHFSSLLNDLNIDQPDWIKANTLDDAKEFANRVSYPLLIRPSYVLSGAAMNIVHDENELQFYLDAATQISPDHPVVISKFIENGRELEIDGVADEGKVVIQAISEHIENAGVHSGDATIVLPPQRLYLETIRRAKRIMRDIIQALKITGPFNIQFIAKDNNLQVIECNVRAARSFPFASKTTGHNFIRIATEVLMNSHQPQDYETLELDYVGVKTPQFSYNRLKESNPVAGVEMASTGEVACLGDDLQGAFFRSWQATDLFLKGRRLFLSIGGDKKARLLDSLRQLAEQGWELYTTEGTHQYLSNHGIDSFCHHKASEKIEPNTTTLISNRQVDLIINIPGGYRHNPHHQRSDGYIIRRLAVDHNIPLVTNIQTANLLLQCLADPELMKRPIKSWQQFVEETH